MFKLTIIDKYIIKKFLGTFFYSILLLTVIIIVFDISEKISDFIDQKAPLKEIVLNYYLNFVPYFINTFSALFTFISVIFFTSKMASNTEIIAILNGGISYRRFLFPYLLSGLFITMMSFALMNYVIPNTNKNLRAFEKQYLKNPFVVRETNIHMQLNDSLFVYVENYNNAANTGYKFAIEEFSNNKLVSKTKADVITWDSLTNKWLMTNYQIRNFHNDGESIEKGYKLDTTMMFIPSDFVADIEDAKIMTYKNLKQYIAREEARGNYVAKKFEMERQKRITFPFANLILTFIGVALSSRKVRGGIGINLGIGITIAFTFILLQQITSVFAVFGNTPASIALWIPNIIYALLALMLLYLAPK